MQALAIFAPASAVQNPDPSRRRHALARLGLAWLAMMQVMMFAFPGYLRHGAMSAQDYSVLDRAIVLMNWISLGLTVPVITYCAWPVWKGACARMRDARISMDLPVALGIIAAFFPSAWSTWTNQGPVYFDSVTMFVAFLLTARYLESCARQAGGDGPLHETLERYRRVLSQHVDRVAVWFTILQLALACAAGAAWQLHDPDRSLGVIVALLVISCPCAMAIAAPMAIAAAHASLRARPGFPEPSVHLLLQRTGRVSRQNLYGSMAWHLLLTPLAMIGWVSPWLAALTMLLSSLAVTGNSWRLMRDRWRY